MKLACTAHATFARMALTPPRVFTVDFSQKPAYRLPDLDASPLNHVLRQEGAKGHGSTAFHDWHFFFNIFLYIYEHTLQQMSPSIRKKVPCGISIDF